jgi:hypothetical protein
MLPAKAAWSVLLPLGLVLLALGVLHYETVPSEISVPHLLREERKAGHMHTTNDEMLSDTLWQALSAKTEAVLKKAAGSGSGSGPSGQTNLDGEDFRKNQVANQKHIWPDKDEKGDVTNHRDISYDNFPASWNYLWAPSRVRTSDFIKNVTLPDYMSAHDEDHAKTLMDGSGGWVEPVKGSGSGSGSPFSRYAYSRYQFNISGLAGPGLPNLNFFTWTPTVFRNVTNFTNATVDVTVAVGRR